METRFVILAVFAALVQNLFVVSGESRTAIDGVKSNCAQSYDAASDNIFGLITKLVEGIDVTEDEIAEAQSKTYSHFESGTYSFLKLDESLVKIAPLLDAYTVKFVENIYGAIKAAVTNGEGDIGAYESGLDEVMSDFIEVPFTVLESLDLDDDTLAQISNYKGEAKAIVREYVDNVFGAINILRDGSDSTTVADLWSNASSNINDFFELYATVLELVL